MIVTCENCTSRFVVDPQVLEPRGRRVRCARCKSVWFQAPPEASGSGGDADMRAGKSEERRQVFQRSPNAAAAQTQDVFAKKPSPPAADALDEQSGVSLDDTAENDDAIPDAAKDEDLAALYGSDGTDGSSADASSSGDMEDLPWGKPRQKRKSQVPALYKERSPLLAVAGWAAVAALILSAVGAAIVARETIAAKVPATKPVYAAVGLDIKPKVISQNVAEYLSIQSPPPQPAYWRDDQLIQEITGTITNTADAPVRIPPLEGILRDRNNNELYRWLFSAQTDILYPGQRASFATEIIDLPQEAAEMELVFAEGRSMPPIAGSQTQGIATIENSR